MDRAHTTQASRRSTPWLIRMLVAVVLIVLASLPPYLDPAPVDPSPTTAHPIYTWAKSTRLFW